MEGKQIGVRITFDGLTPAEGNRAAQELRRIVLERTGEDVVASIESADPDSQDAGTLLAVFFSSAAGAGIAQAIRAYLARRPDDGDRITILTADGTQVVATGEAARTLTDPRKPLRSLQIRDMIRHLGLLGSDSIPLTSPR